MNAWLLDLALLTTVLLAAALLLRSILRDPKSRVLLAWCTWLGIAAAALVTLLPGWPRYDIRSLGGPATTQQPDILLEALAEPLPIAADWAFLIETGPPESLPPPAMPPNATVGELALLTWLTAALLGLAWIALGAWQARRLLRRSQPAPNWIHAELAAICTSDTNKNIPPRPPSHKHSTATASAFHPYKSVSIRCSISSPFRAFSCFLWPFPSVSHALGRVARAVSMFPASDGPPAVRTSAALSSAVALRAHKPAILLPQTAVDPSNPATIRAALAHEWAHIRHGDLWLLALERLLLPVLALHPLFWLLRKSTRLDQELLADAAAAGDQPVEYAEALVAWAKSSTPPPAALAAMAFWDRPSNLTRRVHMILHKPRPAATWFSRLLSLAALTFLLTLVAGLSLVTLQPLAADDERAQPTPALTADTPPYASPAAQAIELVCTVFEVDDAQVVLTKDDQPKPPATLTHLLLDDWQQTSEKLRRVPGFKVLSRPRLRTLNSRLAVIEISQDTLQANEPVGLKVGLVPEVLAFIDDAQQVLLTVQLQRTARETRVQDGHEVPIQVARRLQTKVAVPLGKTLLLVDPSSRDSNANRRPLLLAIEPRLVASGEETRPARASSQAQLSALTERLNEAQSQLAKSAPASDSESRREAAALRQTLLRLQREIAALLDQTAENRVEPAPVIPALPDAKFLFEAPTIPARPAASNRTNPAANANASTGTTPNTNANTNPKNLLTRVFKVKAGNANELAEKLMRKLNEFGFAENARVSPDAQTGAIVVQGDGHAMNFAGEFLEALAEEAPPVNPKIAATLTPSQATPRPALEQKLLELDLREAEIGLQVATAEHNQMAEIRQRTPGALSENELRHSQLKVDLAQVQVERIKVRIEAFRDANPPPPSGPKR